MSTPLKPTSSLPVVQTILESFTRCFNPLDPCTKTCTSKDDCDHAFVKKKSPSPSHRLFGYSIGGGSGGDARATTVTPSRSSSSSGSRRSRDDADGVAAAEKTHRRMLSAQALAERSLKRKLEIFRGTPPPRRPSRSPGEDRRAPSGRTTPPPSSSGRASPGAGGATRPLSLSDDEEELVRLAGSPRRRFACGMNADFRIRNDSPISSVARLFNLGLSEAQKPFGLCFATPVRTADREDVAGLSDDKLTDDEYVARRRRADGDAAHISPGGDPEGSSYCEEETVSSTLYFDQKYSHVVQTRPPMPLFQEHMLSRGMEDGDELSRIISGRRDSSASDEPPVMELVTSQQQRRRGSSRGGGAWKTMGNEPPSPVRIGNDSHSMGTQSEESFEVQMLREPDVVSATAAEI